jgi:hypothetical protein
MCLLELSVRVSKLRRVLGPRFAKTGDEMHREMETKHLYGCAFRCLVTRSKGGPKSLTIFISAIQRKLIIK